MLVMLDSIVMFRDAMLPSWVVGCFGQDCRDPGYDFCDCWCW